MVYNYLKVGKRGRTYPKEAADLKLDKETVAFVQSHPERASEK